MQKEPESARSPTRLRTPSASPVSIDSSRVSPRLSATSPSATSWSPGSTRIQSPGTTSSASSSTNPPSRTTSRLRGDQQREAVERLLRLQLLPDADVAVDHRDEAEERVGEQAEREHDDEEDADDQVEEREDVPGDDARHRAAAPVLDRPELAQPLRGLLARKPTWMTSVGHSRIVSEARRRQSQALGGSQNHSSNARTAPRRRPRRPK